MTLVDVELACDIFMGSKILQLLLLAQNGRYSVVREDVAIYEQL